MFAQIEVCGSNKYFQLATSSNNKNSKGISIISPPKKNMIYISGLLSFSCFSRHSVWVLRKGQAYATGYNCDNLISCTLPKDIISDPTEIKFQHENGQPCNFISAVCGFYYTLYLVSGSKEGDPSRLIYSHSYMSKPLFLDISGRNPISLYGGYKTSAAIDSEGGILIIQESIKDSKINPLFLPNKEKVVKLACCNEFVLALSESGQVFECQLSNKKFVEIPELKSQIIVDISGCLNHCYAVNNEGIVFNRGNDVSFDCNLNEFNEIKTNSLRNYKIVSVFAGCNHSLFVTSEGEVLACGNNDCGQLFLTYNPRKDTIFPPVKVLSMHDDHFFIAGDSLSANFLDSEVPYAPNRFCKNHTLDVTICFHETSKKEEKKRSSSTLSKKSFIPKVSSTKSDEVSALKKSLLEEQQKVKKLEKQAEKEREKNVESERAFKKHSEKVETDLNDSETNFFVSPEDEKHFQVVKQIGEGSTSIVYKIIDKRTLKPLCKKVLKTAGTSFDDAKNAIKEFEVLHFLKHPCICRSIGINTAEVVGESSDSAKETTTISLYLEFIDFTLKECLEKGIINSTLKTRIVVEIAHGMRYLHQKNMFYRDLNLDSIMLNSVFQVKLIDFGLIRINECLFDEDTMDTLILTKNVGLEDFMAPEMMEDDGYDSKVDVYSFGIVLFFIFFGRIPKQSFKEKKKKTPIKMPEKSESKHVSKCCIELISKCLSIDPNDRPSFDEILCFLRENKFMLIADVDPTIVSQRDNELEAFF